jgi:hypothetical protein
MTIIYCPTCNKIYSEKDACQHERQPEFKVFAGHNHPSTCESVFAESANRAAVVFAGKYDLPHATTVFAAPARGDSMNMHHWDGFIISREHEVSYRAIPFGEISTNTTKTKLKLEQKQIAIEVLRALEDRLTSPDLVDIKIDQDRPGKEITKKNGERTFEPGPVETIVIRLEYAE